MQFKIKMSSQQKQIIARCQLSHLTQDYPQHEQSKSRLILPEQFKSTKIQKSNSKNKFDIKRFEQNLLKQILTKKQKNKHRHSYSKGKQSQRSLSHINSFKKITQQRKLSKTKSNSRHDSHLKRLSQQKSGLEKCQLNNSKILRQKLLSDLTCFDDYQMINIDNSIPILNKSKILKVLTSLEQTKYKIQSKHLPEGRVKQEAKFIYFLWKMINQQFVTTRHLKQIILLLHELSKKDLFDTLSDLYNRQGEIVKMFIDCWMNLKMDKFHYQTALKQKFPKDTVIDSSKKVDQWQYRLKEQQKTIKKAERCKTQTNQMTKNEEQQNEQNLKNMKFLLPNQQKKLIQRLYEERKDFINRRERIKTQKDQQKENIEFKKCTFKPLLKSSNSIKSFSKTSLVRRSKNQSSLKDSQIVQNSNQRQQISLSKVKGFQKAVKRMKVGQSQTKLKQQLINYHSVGQNYEKVKQKPMNPPKFLSRQKNKKQDLILFVIQFQIGRHKVKVKIHPTDTEMSISKRISKIYGLKQEQEGEIRDIVSMQLNNYYKKIGEEVSEFIET